MFNFLLNAKGVSVDSIILDIFIILAVVVAGALVVYFLSEAVNSMFTKQKKPTNDVPNFGEKEKPAEEELVVVNLEEQEKVETPEEEVTLDESKLADVDEAKAEEEKQQAESEVSEEERLNAERRAYLEARRQELIRRMQAEMEENEEESEEEEETESTEAEQETAEENVEAVEPQKEEPAVVEEKVDDLAQERQALELEKARYATMIQELEEAKRALAEQNAQEKQVVVETKVVEGALTLEELKARLAAAEERLAKTEKEFKQCKKEYIPLRRIWTAHERDEKKLRRKEALVARQKVLLYGVNNFADIDEEKAKKLSEDLDHLDGLKLSVQHCEEVMAENAERYPLLEKMYNVLNQRNEELKKDIEVYKKEIARIESENAEQ